MLLHHQLHLLIILANRANFSRQDSSSLLGTEILKLGILQQESQCILDTPLLFQSQTVLDLDAILS